MNTEQLSLSASQYGSLVPTGTYSIPSPVEPSSPGTNVAQPYDRTEQDIVIRIFSELLWSVTRDGGKKRAQGTKPPWWRDESHEAAIWSHVNKWKHGEKADKDSGVHPLIHLAWRALAIAYQETYGRVDPQNPPTD